MVGETQRARCAEVTYHSIQSVRLGHFTSLILNDIHQIDYKWYVLNMNYLSNLFTTILVMNGTVKPITFSLAAGCDVRKRVYLCESRFVIPR